MRYIVAIGDKKFNVEIGEAGEVRIDGRKVITDFRSIDGASLYSLLVDNKSYEVLVEGKNGEYSVFLKGRLYLAQVEREGEKRLVSKVKPVATGPISIKAPMPGLVVEISVEEGKRVEADQPLVILEAMKMENEICAPRAGIVKKVMVTEGEEVGQGQLLVVLDTP